MAAAAAKDSDIRDVIKEEKADFHLRKKLGKFSQRPTHGSVPADVGRTERPVRSLARAFAMR